MDEQFEHDLDQIIEEKEMEIYREISEQELLREFQPEKDIYDIDPEGRYQVRREQQEYADQYYVGHHSTADQGLAEVTDAINQVRGNDKP